MVVRCLAGLVLVAAIASGQEAIRWSTVDGGGTTSTGGTFQLRGTIAQADAGAVGVEAGPAIRSGYWPGAVERSRLVFEDGFESGDVSAWSASFPLAVAAASPGTLGGAPRPLGADGPEAEAEADAAELGGPAAIPVLDQLGLLVFSILVLFSALVRLRRRSTRS